MSLKDCRDVPVSTSSHAALAGYERALASLNGFFLDPLAEIEAALAAQPDFVMGHCLRGALMAASTERGAVAELRRSLTAAQGLAGRANAREQGHIAALIAWADGDWDGASAAYDAVVRDWPRDLLALQLAHQLHFFTGRRTALRDLPRSVLPRWGLATPGAGYVHGMLAFGLEENAEYAAAERAGRLALSLEPRDAWAVHAVTHVMEMQGRTEEGIPFLMERVADWAPDNMLAVHNWWHLAMLHLDRDETDQVLRLYDTRVRANRSAVALELLDASALLWRLRLQDVPLGDRFAALADDWAPLLDDGWYAFNDVFAAMALAGAGRMAEVRALIATMERTATGSGTNAAVTRSVGLPLARGMVAMAEGQPGVALKQLLPVRDIAIRFGGSNAQRDVIDWTLTEAALRVGDATLAQTLTQARLRAKPHSPVARVHATRAAGLRQAA